MFRFENSYFLFALLLIPLLTAGYIYLQYKRKKQLEAYGDLPLLDKLMPNCSQGMRHLRFSILMLALACFIFAAANPQVGSSMEKGTRKGVDVMICFDISNSMLAKDISPNRLEASKMAMSRFIDKLQGDRVGLVVFAGKAFVQLPITTDYAAAKMFINYVTPELINEQGTDIAAAIDLAAASMLPEAGVADPNNLANLTSKVILVVSDGEDHFTEAVDMAKEAAKLGITIHTIGIGSTRGEPIPTKGGTGFKTDNEGNTVMTRLNEAMLRDIAAAGNGVYVHAANAMMGFDEILKKINSMDKVDVAEVTFARYDSKFQYPLLLGLILLFLEGFLFTVKPRWKKWLANWQQKMKGPAIFLLAMMLALPAAHAQTRDELSAIRRGNDDFKTAEKLQKEAVELQKKGGEINQRNAAEKMKKAAEGYQNAEINYRKAMEKTKSYDKANYNLGTALYRQGKYGDAEESFRFVSQQESSDKELRAKAFHNLGNSLLQQQKYKESIDAYKNALKLDPKNMNTKYNLEYARKKMIAQQQQQQQNQQNQQNQDQNQQNQNQQGGGQNDQQQNKDQNKDKGQDKNQDQNKDQNQNQDQNQNGDQNKDQQKHQQQQSAADKQRQQENKRQLDALQQNERQIQQKVQQQQQQQGTKHPQEKDW
ncbi:MAG: VWA domain-containing protein [Bacteroidales bacterium]|nr:VWA domain-containing protein [Bacteroidales bacterium]